MPYKSDKQRKYMHAKHPDIAARWDKEHGGRPRKGKPPAKSKKKPVSPGTQAKRARKSGRKKS